MNKVPSLRCLGPLALPPQAEGEEVSVELWERATASAAAYKLQSQDPQVKGVVQHDHHQERMGRKTQRQCAVRVFTKYGLPVEWLGGKDSEGRTVKPASLVA